VEAGQKSRLFFFFLATLTPVILRFIIPNDGMGQNRRMNAYPASAAEKKLVIPKNIDIPLTLSCFLLTLQVLK
jgi:hypothetical protein